MEQAPESLPLAWPKKATLAAWDSPLFLPKGQMVAPDCVATRASGLSSLAESSAMKQNFLAYVIEAFIFIDNHTHYVPWRMGWPLRFHIQYKCNCIMCIQRHYSWSNTETHLHFLFFPPTLHGVFFLFKKERLLAILPSPSWSPQGHHLKFWHFRRVLVKPVCLTTQKQIPIVFSLKTIIYHWLEEANVDLFPLPLLKKEECLREQIGYGVTRSALFMYSSLWDMSLIRKVLRLSPNTESWEGEIGGADFIKI